MIIDGRIGEIKITDKNYIWDGRKPQFTSELKGQMPSRQADRCHSVSWNLLVSVVLELLNSNLTEIFEVGINRLTRMFIRCNKQIEGSEYDNQVLLKSSKKLISAYEENHRGAQDEATKYLEYLNSIRGNLRYASSELYHWNQSVNSSFDPREWCYVENGKVKSNENGSCDENASEYKPLVGKEMKEKPAYYITDPRDGYLLSELIRIGNFIEKSYLTIDRYIDLNDMHVMVSSSNIFEPDSAGKKSDNTPVYYYINGVLNEIKFFPNGIGREF